jgi:hypothetical protein
MANTGMAVTAPTIEARSSAFNWAPVLAGAFASAAVSLALLLLGAGLGLASVSPFSFNNPSVTTVAAGTVIFLVVVHWIASVIGGYLAGRLRVRWAIHNTDEVFFRDTAHGFLTWAVSTLAVAFVVGSLAGALAGGAARAVGGAAGSAIQGASQGAAQTAAQGNAADPTAYFTDMLFRPAAPATAAAPATTPAPAGGGTDATAPPPPAAPAAQPASRRDARAEALRIMVRSAANGEIAPADKTYLATLVAGETGMSQQEAEARVTDVANQAKTAADKAKQTADDARKAGSTLSFVFFFAMLIGAFTATVAGAYGGKLRDELEEIG